MRSLLLITIPPKLRSCTDFLMVFP